MGTAADVARVFGRLGMPPGAGTAHGAARDIELAAVVEKMANHVVGVPKVRVMVGEVVLVAEATPHTKLDTLMCRLACFCAALRQHRMRPIRDCWLKGPARGGRILCCRRRSCFSARIGLASMISHPVQRKDQSPAAPVWVCVCTTYSRAASLHPQHNIQEANIGRQDIVRTFSPARSLVVGVSVSCIQYAFVISIQYEPLVISMDMELTSSCGPVER